MKKISLFILILCFTNCLYAQNAPSADFSITELPIATKNVFGSVSGTLTIPKNATDKVPLIIIIPGAGAVDRDGNSPQLGINANTYKLIATELGKKGYASVRYDKRMVGQSITSTKEKELRFEDYVDDVVSLINILTDDKRFSKIILLGHGDGSLAAMLAASGQPIKAFISVEGAGDPAYKIMAEQMKSRAGFVSDGFNRMLDSLKRGKTTDNIDPALYSVARPSIQMYLMSWFRYDPVQEIKKLKMPILIIHGSTDLQVTTAQAEKLKKAKSDAILDIIPNMNYVLKDAPADNAQNTATYTQPDLPVKSEFVTALINFLSKVK